MVRVNVCGSGTGAGLGLGLGSGLGYLSLAAKALKDEWIFILVNALSSAVKDDSMQFHTMYEVSSLPAPPMACVRVKLRVRNRVKVRDRVRVAAPMACVHANFVNV